MLIGQLSRGAQATISLLLRGIVRTSGEGRHVMGNTGLGVVTL